MRSNQFVELLGESIEICSVVERVRYSMRLHEIRVNGIEIVQTGGEEHPWLPFRLCRRWQTNRLDLILYRDHGRYVGLTRGYIDRTPVSNRCCDEMTTAETSGKQGSLNGKMSGRVVIDNCSRQIQGETELFPTGKSLVSHEYGCFKVCEAARRNQVGFIIFREAESFRDRS